MLTLAYWIGTLEQYTSGFKCCYISYCQRDTGMSDYLSNHILVLTQRRPKKSCYEFQPILEEGPVGQHIFIYFIEIAPQDSLFFIQDI